jgi:hypothetical protein
MNLEQLQSEIIESQVKSIDNKLSEFFTPYFRSAGIKGEITKGKIKWRGIKMKVHYQLGKQSYQLNQRGVNISPVFELVIAKHELTKQQNNDKQN